ncbi:PREDICTED: kinesin-like protein KIF9, partial [Apaloderma vittatum]|uniref:kinesin-like protein KIF9 n=1 Tax=Apaloderma vittatum TaxID=57397 RepID=UPI000521C40A
VFKAAANSFDPVVTIRISYLEIYNETLVDLLTGTGDLAVVDCPQGVYVKGLSIHRVRHEEDALNLLFEGGTNRAIAEHALNKNSSRSHCIFTIYIESRFRAFSDGKCIHSKINLIDLAGSERLSKTGSEGQILKETVYINKSLSFLEQIIIALADSKREHVPFRQSKLTHVLKDSLGGNCNTVLVANVCGEAVHVEETLSSLRFATRMKWITTEPVINETYDQEGTVKALEREIALLKQELAMNNSLVNCSPVTYDPLTDVQIAEIKSQVRKYLNGDIDEIDIVNVRQIQEVFKQFKLIVSQQEREVEARLRSKYALIDKNDFAAISAVGKAVVVDVDGHLVEEEDGQSFGTITARSSSERSSRVSRMTAEQPNSPPSKLVAFEQFQEECGSEIIQIFKENKSILLARKKKNFAVMQRISSIKREMDGINRALETRKQEWRQQGAYVQQKGRIIIDESDFLLLVKLKDLKEEYKSASAEAQELKAEIQYCQRLVDRSRDKLFSEFETWYRESFLIPKDVQEALRPNSSITPGMIPLNRVTCLEEDDEDKFELMQQTTLPGGPASLSFYRAKMKTEQKHTYARTMLSLEKMQKKPGVLTAAGKNKTLMFLQVM